MGNRSLNITLGLVIGLLLIIELIFGSVEISLQQAILNLESIEGRILFESRLPRAILAVLAGVSCALCGLGIQTIFKNPLAGPTTLGVNSGSSLGIALYYLLPASSGVFLAIAPGIFAVIGAVSFLLLLLTTSRKSFNVSFVLIIGLLLSYASFSIIEVLIQVSDDSGMRSYLFWGMGSLVGSWDEILILMIVTLLGLLYFLGKADWLNVYSLGDTEMELMTNKKQNKYKWSILIVLGAWIGVVTAIVGPIAFVGVVVPNVLKYILRTSNVKKLFWPCVLLGAIMVLLSDILSRGIIIEYVFPLNSVLSILGVPIIIYLLIKKKKIGQS